MFNGGGKRGESQEKSKDFGKAIKRLVRELGGMRVLLIISIIFAVGG